MRWRKKAVDRLGFLVVGDVCDVLQSKPQKWVVEDGFQGLNVLEGLDGVDALERLKDAAELSGLNGASVAPIAV